MPSVALSYRVIEMSVLTIFRMNPCSPVPQVIVGTKQGEILTYDLATSSLTDTIEAHSASVSSLHIRPDGQALVSGSADKQVKFWEFQWAGSLEDKVR